MKRLVKFLGLILPVLVVVVLARTIPIPTKQISPLPHTTEGVDAVALSLDSLTRCRKTLGVVHPREESAVRKNSGKKQGTKSAASNRRYQQ